MFRVLKQNEGLASGSACWRLFGGDIISYGL